MKLVGIIIFIAFTALVSFGQGAEYKKFKDEGEVPRISLEEAKKAYDDSTAIFIDARPADVYKQEHIKGAINIPYNTQGSEFDKFPKGKKLIVYCS